MIISNSPLVSAPANGPIPEDSSPAIPSASTKLDDAELVRRFNAGDEAAFVEIATRYRAKLFSVAYRHLRNRADAEEIAQDALIRAYHALSRFRGDCSLSSWLHRITINLACNRHWYFFRRRRHETVSFDYVCPDGHAPVLAETLPSDSPSPASEAAVSEFSELVNECMEKLGRPQREILHLRNELKQSYERIAETLGTNTGTVKSRLARARTSLRQILAETYNEFVTEAG